ncbi:hypothetical protein GF337_20430 [candidate division KSB1 bacterium]|nr:hypothetical protein [candidate division KSB1 bacterium]
MSLKYNWLWSCFLILIILASCQTSQKDHETLHQKQNLVILDSTDLALMPHHVRHYEIFGKYVEDFNNGINIAILKGIDIVQSHAPEGGGYFTGITAVPTESPVYYNLELYDRPLIEVPRNSSYCSGATYAAFIEAMNLIYGENPPLLTDNRFEALRMQEPDGSRREDHIKFWGHWNADGFGNHFALVQYGKMGEVISPEEARPGDFANISWKSGLGHSVIFLGWAIIDGDKKLVYWSSQTGTNGYGDQVISLSKIKSIKIVRLTQPENMFTFNPAQEVTLDVPGDSIAW